MATAPSLEPVSDSKWDVEDTCIDKLNGDEKALQEVLFQKKGDESSVSRKRHPYVTISDEIVIH